MLVQATPEVVQVTGVRVNPTPQGVEVILETSNEEQLQVLTSSYGRTFVANIVNTQLALPEKKAFHADNPAAGITAVTVTQHASSIRVSVTGKTNVPTARVVQNEDTLALSLSAPVDPTAQPPQPPAVSETVQPETPTEPAVEPQQPDEPAQGEEEIEIVVTGEREDGYNVPNASTATRTDTPLRDIPQSIEVVPQEVLRDQNVTRLEDALRNVSGVTQAFSLPGTISTFTIRGFRVEEGSGSNFLRDGLPDPAAGGVVELPNIDRIEVLKGPASVLYGFGNPGGTINLVTKQPLRDPFYEVEATVGNYDFYRGVVDLSGPLNDSKTVLYRLNTSYRNSGSFIDFFDSKYLSFSPVISLNFGERTNLFLEGEYIKTDASFYSGVPLIGSVRSNPNGKIRRNRNFGEPSDRIEQTVSRIGYRLEHTFSENWSLRNAFRATFRDYSDNFTFPTGLNTDNRTLNRLYREYELDYENYSLTTYLTGKFSTGSINHQVVFGVDLNRFDIRTPKFIAFSAQPIDIFAPIYRQPLGNITNSFQNIQVTDSLGIYIQDQITLAENFKLLLGGRFDTFSQRYEFLTDGSESSQSESAFSPRLGIVYQPISAISLYASYARSFTPANGTGFLNTNLQFKPQRGTQYEVGVKADLSDRLAATLAFYELTRTNILIDDPINEGFFIQTGEQRSRGIELSIGGEILPGWNIIAGYAYTDAQITEDEDAELVGNQLNNTPENAFNLWTTYEIQTGELQGLGFGLGLFFVGDRPGNLANTFEIPSYVRTDAAIFYNRDRFRAALNFRNLFDISYFDFALNPTRLHYGQPFTVQGTISWEF